MSSDSANDQESNQWRGQVSFAAGQPLRPDFRNILSDGQEQKPSDSLYMDEVQREIALLKEQGYVPSQVHIKWDGELLIGFLRKGNPSGYMKFVQIGYSPEVWKEELSRLRQWQESLYQGEVIEDGAIVFNIIDGKGKLASPIGRVTRSGGGWSMQTISQELLLQLGELSKIVDL